MDLTTAAIVLLGLLLYSLISRRLEGTPITPPMVFILFGLVIGPGVLAVAHVDPGHDGIHLIAEVTLVLVLFTDAARIDLAVLRRDHNLPQRMLLLGLPLAIGLGALFAALLFPHFSLWEAALLAALLAPTDAALGQAVVSAKQVPVRVRQAINVESGLNDGIALPLVLFFAALAGSAAPASSIEWLSFATLQVTFGPLIGGLAGYVGARCIDRAAERGWSGTAFQGIGVLALSLFCFVASELVGGNGFIAAFVGGLVLGNAIRNPCTFLYEFMETDGQLLMLITFLIFGAVLLPEGLSHVTGASLIYALLSLTVVRMIPIGIALAGTGLRLPTVAFLGWFGPRGLASILFVLLILERADVPHHEDILAVTIITVALSALLHGLTAAPLAKAYGRRAAAMGECAENAPAREMPLRTGMIEPTKRHKG